MVFGVRKCPWQGAADCTSISVCAKNYCDVGSCEDPLYIHACQCIIEDLHCGSLPPGAFFRSHT